MRTIFKYNIINIIISIFNFAVTFYLVITPKFLFEAISKTNLQNILIFGLSQILALITSGLISVFYASYFATLFSLKNTNNLIKNKIKIEKINYKSFYTRTEGEWNSLLFNNLFTNSKEYYIGIAVFYFTLFPLFASVASAFWLNYILGIVMILFSIIWLFYPLFFRKKINKKIQERLNELSKFNANVSNVLKKIDGLLFFNKIQVLPKIIKSDVENLAEANASKNFWTRLSSSISTFIEYFLTIIMNLVIILTSMQVGLGYLKTGILVSISKIVSFFLQRITTFMQYFLNNIAIKKALKKVDINFYDSKKWENFEEKIETIRIENLNFSYKKKPVFKNLNLQFDSGKKYLLKGPNGCGKSTLLKIILGLQENYQGKILINNRDLKKINPLDLVKQISYLDSNFDLIDENIAENIYFFNEQNKNKLKMVIKDAVLENDFLETKNKGEIDQKDFSIGQKQRINLASHLYESKKNNDYRRIAFEYWH